MFYVISLAEWTAKKNIYLKLQEIILWKVRFYYAKYNKYIMYKIIKENIQIKRIVIYLSHLHPQFLHYFINVTALQLYITYTNNLPVGCHAMQLVSCSSTFYSPCPKDPRPKWDLPLLTSPGWHGDGSSK